MSANVFKYLYKGTDFVFVQKKKNECVKVCVRMSKYLIERKRDLSVVDECVK